MDLQGGEMPLDDKDKEWLALTLENAHLKAAERHRKEDHEPLEQAVASMKAKSAVNSRWMKAALTAAASALGIHGVKAMH
jgi:hypothetical protein